MQLGLIIPLQRFLKIPLIPYGGVCNLFYCWELHGIILQSKETLVAVCPLGVGCPVVNNKPIYICSSHAGNIADGYLHPDMLY